MDAPEKERHKKFKRRRNLMNLHNNEAGREVRFEGSITRSLVSCDIVIDNLSLEIIAHGFSRKTTTTPNDATRAAGQPNT